MLYTSAQFENYLKSNEEHDEKLFEMGGLRRRITHEERLKSLRKNDERDLKKCHRFINKEQWDLDRAEFGFTRACTDRNLAIIGSFASLGVALTGYSSLLTIYCGVMFGSGMVLCFDHQYRVNEYRKARNEYYGRIKGWLECASFLNDRLDRLNQKLEEEEREKGY